MQITKIHNLQFILLTAILNLVATPITIWLFFHIDSPLMLFITCLLVEVSPLVFLLFFITGSDPAFVFDDIEGTLKIICMSNLEKKASPLHSFIHYEKLTGCQLHGKRLIINPGATYSQTLNVAGFTKKQLMQVKEKIDEIVANKVDGVAPPSPPYEHTTSHPAVSTIDEQLARKIRTIHGKKYIVFSIVFCSIAFPLGIYLFVLYLLNSSIWVREMCIILCAFAFAFLIDIIRGTGPSFIFNDIVETVKTNGLRNRILPVQIFPPKNASSPIMHYDKIVNYILRGKIMIINPKEDDTRKLNLSSFTDKQILQIQAELDRIITRNAMKS